MCSTLIIFDISMFDISIFDCAPLGSVILKGAFGLPVTGPLRTSAGTCRGTLIVYQGTHSGRANGGSHARAVAFQTCFV